MRTVYKYDVGAHSIPRDHKVLKVDRGYMWLEVDTDAPPMINPYDTFPTGTTRLPARAVHIGTWFEGTFVWHLYQVRN